jgi:hypothetical protein
LGVLIAFQSNILIIWELNKIPGFVSIQWSFLGKL